MCIARKIHIFAVKIVEKQKLAARFFFDNLEWRYETNNDGFMRGTDGADGRERINRGS